MPKVRYTEMYDDNHEPTGYLPMIYDDFERVHVFGFAGENGQNYKLYDTPELAQADFEKGTAVPIVDNCKSCSIRRYRFAASEV